MAQKIVWTDPAKAQLRAIDQVTALRILHVITRYLDTGEGDVKRLQDVEPPEFRLASETTASASTTSEPSSASSPSSTAEKLTGSTSGEMAPPGKEGASL